MSQIAMAKTGTLDRTERGIRLTVAVALGLLAWGYGIPSAEGIGFLVLAGIAAATGAVGFSPADRFLARVPFGSRRWQPGRGPAAFLRDERMGFTWLSAFRKRAAPGAGAAES